MYMTFWLPNRKCRTRQTYISTTQNIYDKGIHMNSMVENIVWLARTVIDQVFNQGNIILHEQEILFTGFYASSTRHFIRLKKALFSFLYNEPDINFSAERDNGNV